MADIICPICQRPNDANAERCWYCQAELTQNQQPVPVNGTDWLNGLREESEKSSEPTTPELQAEPETPEEVPDWLARIRTREQMEREAQAGSLSNTQEEAATPEKKEELPDWLKEIKAGYSGKKSDSDAQESAKPSAPPFEPETTVDPRSASTNRKEDEDTDEWLTKLAAWTPAEEEFKPHGGATTPAESESMDSETVKPSLENLPKAQFDLDSLAALHQSEFRPLEMNRNQEWQKLESTTPESEQSSILQNEQQLPLKDATNPEEELPKSSFDINALRDTIAVQQSNPDFFNENTLPEEDVEDDDLYEDDPHGDAFSIDNKTAVTATDNKKPVLEKSETVARSPDLAPFVPDDLPDWLSSVKLEKTEEQSDEHPLDELKVSSLESAIDETNLPTWLQAAQSTTPKNGKQELKNPVEPDDEGLLAGISGTLKTPGLSGDYRKPVGYGPSLKVSERQKQSANLFSKMVDETIDDEDNELPKKSKGQRLIWRLMVAIAFMTIIFLSDKILAPFVIEPALFPPEVVSVYDQVDSIPADKPVLLVADFEAAVAGELSLSSQAMLEHLMRRNLDIVILSSNPSGSTMMIDLIQDAALNVAGYDLSAHLTSLGYLAGGSTGVQLLATNLRAAMPYTHDLDAAWNSESLNLVNTLSDFGALIILSDKSESSRSWVEQIQPGLGATPLMFIISAQAAPLMQPYYQSGQISGYIAGFYGSLAYKQMMQQSNSSLAHLGAFQSAMLLTVVMIFLSGLVTLIRPASSVRKG